MNLLAATIAVGRILKACALPLVLLTLPACAATNYGPRPAAWCGWFMRQQVPVDPGREYDRAAKWRNYGERADAPAPGVIVVWPHHVARIVAPTGQPGVWVMRSGNDGHAVRERPRLLRGQIALRR